MRCYDGKCIFSIFIIYVIELFTKFDQNCVPSPWCPSSAGLSVSGWGPFLRDPHQHRRNLHSLRPAPPGENRFIVCICVQLYSLPHLLAHPATDDLGGVTSRPLKQPTPALWQNRFCFCTRVHTACTLLSRRDCREPACESPMLSQEKLVSRTETKPGSTQSCESCKQES